MHTHKELFYKLASLRDRKGISRALICDWCQIEAERYEISRQNTGLLSLLEERVGAIFSFFSEIEGNVS